MKGLFMRQLIIGDRIITDDSDPFIIAEIGSNHCGDFELAKQMIVKAAECGADAVKFQKRDNETMFTKIMLQMPYNNDFSVAPTYGEHRQKLDWFGEKEFKELQELAEKHGILMFATPFEEKSADFLRKLNMPLYKIASCDVTNIPLIKYVAEFGKPILISIGGAQEKDIDRVYQTINKFHDNFAFLHCVATYPNRDEDLNLAYIGRLRERYPDIMIGFSSHHSGLDPVKEAYFLGARIFEVHFTLNRGFRGTDHGFSLEPNGLAKLCEDLRRIKKRLGKPERIILEDERKGFCHKMGKAIHIARPIHKGKEIEPEDIIIKAPADGLPPYEEEKVIGKIAISDLSTADTLTWEDLK
jgi:N-acetylneuraminate synthase/sialic acid synthase